VEENVQFTDPASSQVGSDQPKDEPSPGRSLRRFRCAVIVPVIVVVLLAVVVSAYLLVQSRHTKTQTTPPAQVTITSHGFSPETIRIRVGQSVVWTNKDSRTHQVASDPYPSDTGLSGFLDPVPMQTGQTYGFTFGTKGIFTYHDQLQPYGFKGEVTVQ
jgi:plastocyanin